MANFVTFFIVITIILAALFMTSVEPKKKPGKPGKPSKPKTTTTRQPTTGGLGPLKPADEKVRQLVRVLETRIQDRVCEILSGKCKRLDPIKALAYREQYVSGMNYFVAVTAENYLFHAKIFEQSWNNTVALIDVRGPKGEKEDIVYF